MRIIAARTRTERWSLDGTGAARGRTERISIFLDVTTDDGHTGTGEAAPLPGLSIETLDDASAGLAAFVDAVTRAPIDLPSPTGAHVGASRGTARPLAEDAAAHVSAASVLARAHEIAARFAATAPAACFALETALLSAYAAHAGASVAALLPHLRAIVLEPSVVVDDPEQAARAVAEGAQFLKVKVGPALGREHIEAIARAAPAARLRLDANRSWPLASVRERLAALAGLPVDYVEEPCPDAHRLLDGPIAVPIALDESLAELSTEALSRAVASPHLAALVLKPTLLGGFAACIDRARARVAPARRAHPQADRPRRLRRMPRARQPCGHERQAGARHAHAGVAGRPRRVRSVGGRPANWGPYPWIPCGEASRDRRRVPDPGHR